MTILYDIYVSSIHAYVANSQSHDIYIFKHLAHIYPKRLTLLLQYTVGTEMVKGPTAAT